MQNSMKLPTDDVRGPGSLHIEDRRSCTFDFWCPVLNYK